MCWTDTPPEPSRAHGWHAETVDAFRQALGTTPRSTPFYGIDSPPAETRALPMDGVHPGVVPVLMSRSGPRTAINRGGVGAQEAHSTALPAVNDPARGYAPSQEGQSKGQAGMVGQQVRPEPQHAPLWANDPRRSAQATPAGGGVSNSHTPSHVPGSLPRAENGPASPGTSAETASTGYEGRDPDQPYLPNDTVRHAKFGPGRVVEVEGKGAEGAEEQAGGYVVVMEFDREPGKLRRLIPSLVRGVVSITTPPRVRPPTAGSARIRTTPRPPYA